MLTYSYGANGVVSPTFYLEDGDAVVALRYDITDDGPHPAIALHGEARFDTFGPVSVVRYPDGEELDCATE